MACKSAKQLREERAPCVKAIRELAEKVNAESRDFTAEEQGNWDKANADCDALSKQIVIAERVESLPSEHREERQIPGTGNVAHVPGGDETASDHAKPEDRALALQAWALHGRGKAINERHREAVRKTGMSLDTAEINITLVPTHELRGLRNEMRVQNVSLDTAGGFTSPEGFIPALERAMLHYGGMRQVADIMRTATGEALHWPTTNDTGNTGELISEVITAQNEQDVTFGQVTFNAYQYSSKMVRVSNQLLQDSAFDFASTLGSMLGERLGRIENTHFTTGDGAAKPRGIVTASTAGKTTASGSAIAADEIIDLVHSVDIAYRAGAQFMFHDGILQAIRKLKDGQGQYLWQPGMNTGVPDRIFGYTYAVNNDMQATVTTATKTMLFGQLGKYKIRDVNGITLVRLNERYAELNQVAFLAFMRTDGNLLEAGTAPVKHLLQA